jgi:general secretion pathway protein M
VSGILKSKRMALSVGLVAGSLALLAVYAIVHFWMLRQAYAEAIEDLVPRTARLQGIVESEEQLVAAAASVDETLAELAWPLDKDAAMTAASMQQLVRDAIANAGLTVSGSQILPAQPDSGFERLVLDLTASGNIESLDEAIVNLKELRPMVLIESATIKPVRARRRLGQADDGADQRLLSIRMRLVSLRLLPL